MYGDGIYFDGILLLTAVIRPWVLLLSDFDAARWDLGDLVYAMEPESFGAKIRDMKYP